MKERGKDKSQCDKLLDYSLMTKKFPLKKDHEKRKKQRETEKLKNYLSIAIS